MFQRSSVPAFKFPHLWFTLLGLPDQECQTNGWKTDARNSKGSWHHACTGTQIEDGRAIENVQVSTPPWFLPGDPGTSSYLQLGNCNSNITINVHNVHNIRRFYLDGECG
ncbi:hypothetical protein BO70DRAFT_398080 [Aspergillus heteromorphus CBS 117.55]|uniref:Uncharacterized protein n=1 Tax=Aspergillus heteromorphus CBS 117.55 TaxID=1448321 RepID=A0A317VT60_9EURO|nr:uncharacterized protein BO70DRAFT_398080 [Aspergillus heteromorphus CBS 117.55]PWY76207.1 hypothetical protein BO70DRAFT_398080 [Aspergillus heteromorphus CBS 117.55]